MAKKYLTHVDLSGNELQNANLQVLATAPTGASAGRSYFDSTLATPRTYNGTSWINLDATKATGIPTSAIASFQAVVQATPLNAFAVPTGNLNLGGVYTVAGVPTPTVAGQVAEYSWVLGLVQSAAAGIVSKSAVKAVSTANIASLSGTTTIDGVGLSAGDRVLLVGQTSTVLNGVWVVATGVWVRPTVEGATAELDPGAQWFVLPGGTVNGATQWRMATTGAITPGTTPISVVQSNASAAYSAGNGLVGSSTFAVNPVAAGGITVSASGVAVDPTIVARKYSVTIGDGSATSYTVTHSLNTQDVHVGCHMISGLNGVEVDWAATTVNTVTISVNAALAANSLRVTVLG